MIDWGWIGDHLGAILGRTVQHIWLASIAVAVGFAISFGLALVIQSRRSTYTLISGLAGTLYTIPSLAVFAALVSVTGLTIYTAVIPLIMYTLVILVRNIVAGFDAAPDDVLDAADGMGYDRRERFRKIVLPLSIPLVVRRAAPGQRVHDRPGDDHGDPRQRLRWPRASSSSRATTARSRPRSWPAPFPRSCSRSQSTSPLSGSSAA